MKLRHSLTPIAAAIAALCSHTAIAEQATSETEQLVVWGTQIMNSSDLLSTDIEVKQADHLSDLLRDQPGVDVGGTHSLMQSINIRGVTELDLDISIDGVSQSNNVFHHVGNLLINPNILKAVDLQVGNNSVINGGLAGGVAFEIKDAQDLLEGDDQAGARLAGSFADNDYVTGSFTSYSQLNDHVDLMAYYSYINRNNPVDGDGRDMAGQEGITKNYVVKAGFDVNAANRLVLGYDLYEDAGDYPLRANFGSGWDHDGMILPIEYTRETVQLQHELSLANTTVNSTLYHNELNYLAQMDSESEGNTVNIGLTTLAESDVELGGIWHTPRYGFEVEQQSAQRRTDGERVGIKEQADSYAIYLEDEIELLDGFFVTPGARYDNYQVESRSADDTFSEVSYALAAKYQFADAWTLRASATELFKGPGLTGSFLSADEIIPNPDLKPETGLNMEAGIAYQAGTFGLDSFGFSVTAFETQLDDYIEDSNTGKYGVLNVGDVTIQGFESVLSMSHGDFDGRLTYARSDSEFTSIATTEGVENFGYVLGQSLDKEVGDSLSLGLDYHFPTTGLSVHWTSLVTLDLEKDVEADQEKAGYDVHNLSVRWIPTAHDNFSLTAGVENIFDETYASHASTIGASSRNPELELTDYEPGRNVKVSLAYTF